MSSRRKASTPCMVRPEQTMVELDDEEKESHHMDVQTTTEKHTEEGLISAPPSTDGESSMDVDLNAKVSETNKSSDKPTAEPPKPPRKQQGGYECKYCTFSTQNLNTFKEHVDSNHPNVILNPLYLCAVCNFNTKKFDTLTEHNERRHPGESNFKFKRIKKNNQTILEQTIEGCSNTVIYNAANKLVMAPQSKASTVKANNAKVTSSDDKQTEPRLGNATPDLAKKAITALNVNGTVIIPESTLLKAGGLSHIMPSLQQPLNYTQVPKIAVPLNTTKYNPSLDDNLTLISSFNKFPYPTQAELSWLTAASKHPEEQIKVWFTTQRLKQGISWSPEEVEEARKKMFNGTISTGPQTLTVVASQISSRSSPAQPVHSTASKPLQQTAASVLQSLPCQLLGQSSLVLTPVANGSTVTCAPLALTVATQVAQSLKRPLACPVITTESKRPSIIQTVSASSRPASSKVLSFTVDPNKTAEQLSVLRSSYTQCPFPEEDEIYRLIETTGLSRGEIKKWFSEQRLLNLKNIPTPPVLVKAEAAPLGKDVPVKKAVPHKFPLLERVKGKTSEQLKALEESFQRSCSPSEAELGQLAQETRLSKTEVDCWFSERRALRDNMEKVLLTMASKNTEDRSERQGGALLNGTPHREHNGKPLHCSLFPLSSSSPPALAASSPQPPTLSSSTSPPVLTSSRSSPHPPPAAASLSPTVISTDSLALLRETFCRTQWPTPEEYSQLEAQTSLGRTDIVRWFKEHRSALKNGEILDWMEGFQQAGTQPAKQNGQSSEKQLSAPVEGGVGKASSVEEEADGKEAQTESSRLFQQDKLQWLTDRLAEGVAGLSRAGQDHTGTSPENKDKWVKVTVAVGEETAGGVEQQKPATVTEAVALEQPGQVTG
ncbi:zinc fingers and homeoboxes protein 2 [Oryzias latipes]|uniref:Zinc fingers and homeoboxes 2a n=2 Tax=Oryzias latipes TaxID=8090 RepID=H2N2J8_ORYLA|nr:zinc fingers and homeoboxes protein 2 [Oryzias latipes]XP_020557503.1 zinc fingers and homeoboxes protein 2 [Oryzias latipes]XP_020557504.1 zinc fingers and homeoboxes protein 2 [Oryzias latipes]